MELGQGRRLLDAPGERNACATAPRRVRGDLPWNFPLAIPTGRLPERSPAASGVLKPAEQSPASALACVEALRQEGVPAEALHLLPGEATPGRRSFDTQESRQSRSPAQGPGLEII